MPCSPIRAPALPPRPRLPPPSNPEPLGAASVHLGSIARKCCKISYSESWQKMVYDAIMHAGSRKRSCRHVYSRGTCSLEARQLLSNDVVHGELI